MNRRVNWTLVSGFTVSATIVALAVFHSTSTPWIFMNFVGFVIVAGGICGASLVMYPFSEIKDLVKTLWHCFLARHLDRVDAIQEIIHLNQLQGQDPVFYNGDLSWIKYMILRDGVELLSLGIDPGEIRVRMQLLSDRSRERRLKHSGMFLTIAKLGPGFGLLGTLLGLVVMLQDLGAGGDFDRVGPALAISLLATLYGVVSANLIFQPLSELIAYQSEEGHRLDQLIIDGVILVKAKRHSIEIRDALRVHLDWDENVRFNQTLKIELPNATGGNESQAQPEQAGAA